MIPGQRERAVEVVADALALAPDERDRFVRARCGDDEALLDDVLSLVAAAANAGSFLDRPTQRHESPSHPQLAAEPFREQPGMTIGRYKLLEQIGEGGFGVVFMAEQREPVQRRVALKVIKLGMDTRNVVARFEAERQALALMDHPGIAKVLDAGATPGGRPYFVMELVKGDAITRYCDRNHSTISERLALFAQVCHAVQHAHTRGLIHRDIKPGNVLVSTLDGRPSPRIIDFGIAKATQSRLTERTVFTEFRQLLGTPEYMSPEQAEGSLDIDTRTDVYSLGVLLYELLTGATPLDGPRLRSAAFAEMQRIIREVDPPRPSTKLSQASDTLASVAASRRVEPRRLGTLVRGELDWIVMKALEKNRARRYDSASALAEDLHRYLEGRAVVAAPPGGLYQARKFILRHRVGVATASLVGLALLLGMAGTGAGIVRARRERDRAVAAELQQAALRKQAEIAAAQSETVAGFLGDMLGGVGPAVAQGRDTAILREILDKTQTRLEMGELKDEPAAEADLRHVLGAVFTDLGEQDRAITLHRDALRLRVATAGPESLDATTSMNDLAKALWHAERYPEAEELLTSVLDIRKRTLQPDDPDIAIALNNLGMLRKERGDLDGAEKLLREALDLRERSLGRDNREFVTSISNLATLYFEREDYARAEPLARQALQISRRINGPRHPSLAQNLNTLAWIRETRGDHAEAEPLLREALEIRRAVLPSDHPSICDSLENLALNLQHRAPTDPAAAAEAVLLLEQSLAISRTRPPPATLGGETQTARIMQELGRALLDAARPAEAEEVLEECIAMRARLFPDGHPSAWTRYLAIGLLADALIGQGESQPRLDRAESLALDAANWFRAHYRPKNPDSVSLTRQSAQRLVDFYIARAAANPGSDFDRKAAEWRDKLRPPLPVPASP